MIKLSNGILNNFISVFSSRYTIVDDLRKINSNTVGGIPKLRVLRRNFFFLECNAETFQELAWRLNNFCNICCFLKQKSELKNLTSFRVNLWLLEPYRPIPYGSKLVKIFENLVKDIAILMSFLNHLISKILKNLISNKLLQTNPHNVWKQN